ncbi:hypothetical protein [Schinkia azotoformans]|uniref:hypothetical protein n=1 Tax=Schinkia azotoformans TaxID=1454 RepID=UPI002DB9E2B4|nr:hypothetical protein [Schinkia azotoformans]MEC1714754.1 hypothetical protein [Schinkia azotoformans]MEC1757490.1 hypothetical protein [Schinkia azotoformans]
MKKIIKYIRSLIVSLWLLFAKKKEGKAVPSLMPLNLQFFAGDDGGDDDPGDDDPDDDKKDNKDYAAVFKTKDELNKRLGRAERKGQKELAKQLGYDSVEDMLEALNKNKDKDTNKDKDPDNKDKDKDKSPEGLTKEDVKALLDAQMKDERKQMTKRLINTEVKAVATELGINPKLAIKLLDVEDALENEDIKVTDTGVEGVKEALEELAKEFEELKPKKQDGFGADIPNSKKQTQKSLENIKKLAASRGTQQTAANNPWA